MDLTTVDKLLTTTRSVRKRLDLTRPVEPEVLQRCLDIAIQAPTGSNRQHWHWMVVTDPEKRAGIAACYKQAFDAYIRPQKDAPPPDPDDPLAMQMRRVTGSAIYLADHLHEVPVMVIPCLEGRPRLAKPAIQASHYGSILPAAWSFMLALRARGLGSVWTTLHLRYEEQVAALLGIPEPITQAALIPVAYYTGDDFQPAERRPAREITYWDSWGETR